MNTTDPSVNRQLTFGEKAVGLSFNPSSNPLVDDLKRRYADVIDKLNDARATSESQDAKRYFSLAITEAQSSQMWAVKAVTWKD